MDLSLISEQAWRGNSSILRREVTYGRATTWQRQRLLAQLTAWATIPPDLVACLTRDQQVATPPTPLQRWLVQVLAAGRS